MPYYCREIFRRLNNGDKDVVNLRTESVVHCMLYSLRTISQNGEASCDSYSRNENPQWQVKQELNTLIFKDLNRKFLHLHNGWGNS